MSRALAIAPLVLSYRIGLSVHDPIASVLSLRDAIDERPRLAARHGIGGHNGQRLMIWLHGHCRVGSWVVGPEADAPSYRTAGCMGFVTDTLHEAIVVRRAIEPTMIWGEGLRIWERGSSRRLSSAMLHDTLAHEAAILFHVLDDALRR